MIEKTLAKRYAAALLKVTDAEGSTEETESFLLALKDAYLSQKDFRAAINTPSGRSEAVSERPSCSSAPLGAKQRSPGSRQRTLGPTCPHPTPP